jgi:hypothetical protein
MGTDAPYFWASRRLETAWPTGQGTPGEAGVSRSDARDANHASPAPKRGRIALHVISFGPGAPNPPAGSLYAQAQLRGGGLK